MPKINIDNYDTVASWNGSQDLFVVEQPDGTKVATPAMVKQFIEAGDFEATGEVKDGHGNILADMAKADEVKGIAEAGDFAATGEIIDGHGNTLASRLNWKVAGAFSADGSITLNYSLDSASEIMVTLFEGLPRQTVLIDSISRLRQYDLFPDFITYGGRVYARISYVDATHVNISQLTGLGSSAKLIIEIR